MKNVLMVVVVIAVTGCNFPGSSAGSPAAASSSGSSSSSGSTVTSTGSSGSTPVSPKAMVQSQGCSTAKAKGGANVQCSDGSASFIPNGSPFMVQDASGNAIGDHLMSLFNGNFLVWDTATNSMFNYSTGGDLGVSNLGFTSSDCSGQAYVGMGGDQNGLINTVFNTRTGALFKATAPAEAVTINSILYSGSAYASTGGCQALSSGTEIQGTFPQAMAYSNSSFSAKVTLPLSIVMNTGN